MNSWRVPSRRLKRPERSSARPLWLADEEGTGAKVTLDESERSTHLHVVGASSTGKSRFLEHLIRQDIREGRGLCLIDPHGTLYERVVRWAALSSNPPRTIRLLQPGKPGWTFGFNPLAFDATDRAQRDFAVGSIVAAIAQVWGGEDHNRTPRLKRNLKLVLTALFELGLTLPEAIYLLRARDTDGTRSRLIERLTDPVLRESWEEIAAYRPAEFNERFESTLNRLFEFTGSAVVGTMLRQTETAIDTRRAMDEGHVLLVDLSEHGSRFSRDHATLLGALLVNDFMLKARGRGDGARPFHLYVDECHRFLTQDVEDILFEARKFGLHVTLAHQDLSQLGPEDGSMYGAVMSGAQTKVIFRLGRMSDAKRMAEEKMYSEIDYEDKKPSFVQHQTVGYDTVRMASDSFTRGTSETHGTSESTTRSNSLSHGLSATESHSRATSSTESESSSESSGGSTSSGTSEGAMLTEDGEAYRESAGSSESSSESSSSTTGSSSSTTTSSGTTHSVTESFAETTGKSRTRGTSHQRGTNSAETHGTSEALRPIIRKTNMQGYTLEEQFHRQARELAGLPNRHAIIVRRSSEGQAVQRVVIPTVEDLSPHAARRAVRNFEGRALKRSEFAVELAEGSEVEEAEVLSITDHPAPPQEEPEDW